MRIGSRWRCSPPLWLGVALLRGGGARTGFWAGVLALAWFSHGVMVAWTRPPERLFACAEIALAVGIVGEGVQEVFEREIRMAA